MSDSNVVIERPDIGEWLDITVTFIKVDSEPDPKGIKGTYSVTYVLGPTSYSVDNANFDFDINQKGDSFLQFYNPDLPIDKQCIGVKIDVIGPNGESAKCEIRTNSKGRMSQINFPVILAESFNNAESKAYNLIQPILGWISLQYDIPVEITQIHSEEHLTSSVKNSAFVSPKIKGLDSKFEIPFPMSDAILECVSQYREAMNSVNDFYRLFCLFKSSEGLKHVRTKINKIAGKNKLSLQVRKESIRITQDLANSCNMPNLAGTKLGEAHDKLWNLSRNSLAHLDLETGKFISLHNTEDLYNVRRLIPMLQFIVKTSVSEETKAYKELNSQLGTTVVI